MFEIIYIYIRHLKGMRIDYNTMENTQLNRYGVKCEFMYTYTRDNNNTSK